MISALARVFPQSPDELTRRYISRQLKKPLASRSTFFIHSFSVCAVQPILPGYRHCSSYPLGSTRMGESPPVVARPAEKSTADLTAERLPCGGIESGSS